MESISNDIVIGFCCFIVVVALCMSWYYARNNKSPIGLNWKSDLKDLWIVVEQTLYKEKYWLLALLVLEMVHSFLYLNQAKVQNLELISWIFAGARTVVSYRFYWSVVCSVGNSSSQDISNLLPFKIAWFRYLIMDILLAIPTGIGMIFFGFPGIMCLVLFCLGRAIATYTNAGAYKALNESARLIGSNFPAAASYVIPAALVLMLLPIGASLLTNNLWFPLVPQGNTSPIMTAGYVFGSSFLGLAAVLAEGLLTAFTCKLFVALKSQQPQPVES